MNENPHQAGKENYTPNGHTQTLLIFYRAHSKLFHTLTLILQKEISLLFYKRERETSDDTLKYISLLVECYGFFPLSFFSFYLYFDRLFSTEGTSSFYRSLEP